MWIQDKWGNAINSHHIMVIRCDSQKIPFQVEAWLADYGCESDSCMVLREFETRDEAKKYINNLVVALNVGDCQLGAELKPSGWENSVMQIMQSKE